MAFEVALPVLGELVKRGGRPLFYTVQRGVWDGEVEVIFTLYVDVAGQLVYCRVPFSQVLEVTGYADLLEEEMDPEERREIYAEALEEFRARFLADFLPARRFVALT